MVDAAVAEAGQPRRFARRELESALGLLDALPALAEAIRPRPVPATSGSTLLEWAPYGVVLGWHAANSPVWVPTVVAASALAGGNAVLARPSSRARRTGALVLEALGCGLARRGDRARRPARPRGRAAGLGPQRPRRRRPRLDRHLQAPARRPGGGLRAGARLRPYIAEGSGNDAMIVLAGADLDRAAQAAAIGGFANAGQLCMAAKRIIVERAAWEAFRPRLAAAVAALRVG